MFSQIKYKPKTNTYTKISRNGNIMTQLVFYLFCLDFDDDIDDIDDIDYIDDIDDIDDITPKESD